MMCVWKPRPVSDGLMIMRTGISCPVLLVSLLTILVTVTAPVASPGQVVTFTEDWQPQGQEKEWLGQDRRWLKSLPAARKFIAPDFPDSLQETGQSLDPVQVSRLKSLVAAAGATSKDTLPVVRPVAALMRDRWMDRGYLSAAVVTKGDSLLIRPGPVWTIGVLDVAGDDFPGRNHLLATWLPRAGERFQREDLSQGIDMVLIGTGETGYPFPRWVTREVVLESDGHTVTIKAMLLPGNLAYIGPVTSDLEQARAARFLARSTGLRSGSLFQHSDLEKARQRLLSRDLYTTVGEPTVYLTSSGDTVGIHFPVVARRKVNRLTVILGLSRPAETTGTRVSGEVDLRLPNMAGTGRSLQIGWRDDGQRLSRFGFAYLEPLAFGTPLDMSLALDNEVDRDIYTRFRLENNWRISVVSLWGVELGVGWDRATYPVGTLESTSRVRARGAVLHNRGDRTLSGWEGLFAIETARRSSTPRSLEDGDTPSTAQLAEVVTQRIFEVDSSGEWWLVRTLSLFGRASFRQLTGGELNVPLSEQFRFGGATTLRGYREFEFNGSVAAWGSVEARIGRPGGSRLYTFYDLGYFEFWTLDPMTTDPTDLVRFSGRPRGYGLGILARTAAGDISLAVGFPGTVDFDQAKLHVTLLESF